MPRSARFRVTQTDKGWMINIPASFSDAGKRERRYFSTREAAKRESARLREQALRFGEAAATIRPSLAEAAEQASRAAEEESPDPKGTSETMAKANEMMKPTMPSTITKATSIT